MQQLCLSVQPASIPHEVCCCLCCVCLLLLVLIYYSSTVLFVVCCQLSTSARNCCCSDHHAAVYLQQIIYIKGELLFKAKAIALSGLGGLRLQAIRVKTTRKSYTFTTFHSIFHVNVPLQNVIFVLFLMSMLRNFRGLGYGQGNPIVAVAVG